MTAEREVVVGLDSDDLATVIAALELTVEVDRDEYPDAGPLLDRLVGRLNDLVGGSTQKPRLMRSPLTGTVYLVTRYTDFGDPAFGVFESHEKYPVDAEELVAIAREVAPEPNNPPRLDPRSIDNGGTHG